MTFFFEMECVFRACVCVCVFVCARGLVSAEQTCRLFIVFLVYVTTALG